jgi:hypothetical protein
MSQFLQRRRSRCRLVWPQSCLQASGRHHFSACLCAWPSSS